MVNKPLIRPYFCRWGGRLTSHKKNRTMVITPENRLSQKELVFQASTFRCYVSFREGTPNVVCHKRLGLQIAQHSTLVYSVREFFRQKITSN